MDTEPLPRAGRRRLGGAALFGLWAAAAAVSVGVGFGAVHLVGQEVIDPTPRRLTASSPQPAAAAASRTTAAALPASPSPSRSTGRPAPTAAGAVRSYVLAGGTVGVRCTGSTIGLAYAAPRPGFGLEKGHTGPHEVEVEFEGGAGKSEFKASCSGGRVLVQRR